MNLNEKSVSKTQQRLMGMVHAYNKGELDTENLDKDLLIKIKKISKNMKKDDIKDFAKTKHDKIPLKVENMITKFDNFINEYGRSWGRGLDEEDMIFIVDQLVNSMEFVDDKEFAENISSQTSISYQTAFNIFKSYWELSARERSDMEFDWYDWVENQLNNKVNENNSDILTDKETGNLFGFAQYRDNSIKKIGSFTSYTKNLDPKTPRERSILAGQYIDNNKIKGYINRIEGNKVFVESAENPGEIVEISIKDAIKTIENKSNHTVLKKINGK